MVIHVGVSSLATKLTIESQAFRKGYNKPDCDGKIHVTGECCMETEGEDCIKSNIDVQQLCDHVNKSTNLEACVSTHAGR